MKSVVIAAFTGLVLAACQTLPGAPAGPTQLSTQADMAPIIGRTLTFGPGQTMVVRGDGAISGDWDGKPLVGQYKMKDGFFCRTLSQGPRGPSPESCQLWVLDGRTINVARDRGKGAKFSYTVS